MNWSREGEKREGENIDERERERKGWGEGWGGKRIGEENTGRQDDIEYIYFIILLDLCAGFSAPRVNW